MHDSHVHGSCAECASFVTVFPPETAFGDWGYCRQQTPEPPTNAIESLQSAVLTAGGAALRHNQLGFYRTEPDDACDFIQHLE